MPEEERAAGHFSCPFCAGYDVDRMFVASVGVDACVCADCGARWDESERTGEFLGQSHTASVVLRRRR